MWSTIIRRRWFPVAVILLLLCFGTGLYTGITKKDSAGVRTLTGITVPLQRMITHMAVGVADTYNKYFNYDALVQENDQLRQQVSDLTDQLNETKAAQQENESLRAMLGVVGRSTKHTYAMAEVVGKTIDEWSAILTIDAGAAEGLSVNDCVVDEDGMIGYITDVSEHAAQVTTVIDTNMQCGAMISRTRQIAVAEGDYSLMAQGTLKLDYLEKGTDVKEGDTIITSGSGGVFPKGLTIGTVTSVGTESDGMSDYAVLEPAVNINRVTRVYIITDYAEND